MTTPQGPDEIEAEIQELTRRCQQEGGSFDECQQRAIDIVRQRGGQAPTTDRLRAGVDIQSGR